MRKHVWSSVVLVMILTAMFLTTSCASKKVKPAEPVAQTEPEVQKVVQEKAKEVAVEENLPQQEAPAPMVPEQDAVEDNIYFAFDSSDLSSQAREILNNNADYLNKHSNLTITVEGHCDDRGSEAYNNALGKRRAESVKKFLMARGISTDRLATISYGENRPAVMGHDESSWARNRRAHIVVNLASEYPKSAKN